MPLKPLGEWRVSSHTAHFDRACSCGPQQALKSVCYSSHMHSLGDPEECLRTHWHTLLIEEQSISRNFQPILLVFSPGLPYRQTSQEEGRESRCLVCRWAQKYSQSIENRVISVHVTAGHHPLPQKMELNWDTCYCYGDRWSDCCCFLIILLGRWHPVWSHRLVSDFRSSISVPFSVSASSGLCILDLVFSVQT